MEYKIEIVRCIDEAISAENVATLSKTEIRIVKFLSGEKVKLSLNTNKMYMGE